VVCETGIIGFLLPLRPASPATRPCACESVTPGPGRATGFPALPLTTVPASEPFTSDSSAHVSVWEKPAQLPGA
jgi:hypothetical protein